MLWMVYWFVYFVLLVVYDFFIGKLNYLCVLICLFEYYNFFVLYRVYEVVLVLML